MMIYSSDILADNYKEIIALLCKEAISNEKLEELKKMFEDDIDSNRRYEWIDNLEKLIQVLERRAVISCTKISNLYSIAKVVGGSKRIGYFLNRHSTLLSKVEPKYVEPLFGIAVLSDTTPLLPESVEDYLVTNIKNSWESFAKALMVIKEGAIDRIEVKHTRNEDRIREVLEIYLYEAKLQRLLNPYNVLLTALEKIRRRDCREQVEEMLKENKINKS